MTQNHEQGVAIQLENGITGRDLWSRVNQISSLPSGGLREIGAGKRKENHYFPPPLPLLFPPKTAATQAIK